MALGWRFFGGGDCCEVGGLLGVGFGAVRMRRGDVGVRGGEGDCVDGGKGGGSEGVDKGQEWFADGVRGW